MNTIKLDIKNIVKSNLQEKRDEKFYESFMKLHKLEDKSLLGEQFMQTSLNLMREGYTIDDIENFLNEIENPLSGITDKIKGSTEKVDWSGMMKDSLYSSAREYIIKWILDYVGLSSRLPGLSTSLAQFFADRTPLELLKPFKNEQYCIQSLPGIIDGVLEVSVRYLGGKVTGTDRTNYEWSGAPSVAIGNLFGAAIEKSNISETISTQLCKMIH
jgi:hypothetical protein